MKTALLFSGQGERGLVDAVRQGLAANDLLLKRAIRASGCTESSILAQGGRALERSSVQQPITVALALSRAHACTEEVDAVAGHSLGELAAWSFAGAIPAEEAVDIAAARGRAMSRAAAAHPGSMLAIADVPSDALDSTLQIGRAHGTISVGAYNAPSELVLTGSLSALDAVAARCKSRRLAVEGAWHSPLMEGAKTEFASALEDFPALRSIRPVVSGVDGARVEDTADLAPRLLAQLTEPLRWTSVHSTLASLGIERFLIAGPGRVLRYLVRCNQPAAEIMMI